MAVARRVPSPGLRLSPRRAIWLPREVEVTAPDDSTPSTPNATQRDRLRPLDECGGARGDPRRARRPRQLDPADARRVRPGTATGRRRVVHHAGPDLEQRLGLLRDG